MADQASVEEVASSMLKAVTDAKGMKKLKPGDLTKAMVKKYGGSVDKKFCKKGIRALIESGRCVVSARDVGSTRLALGTTSADTPVSSHRANPPVASIESRATGSSPRPTSGNTLTAVDAIWDSSPFAFAESKVFLPLPFWAIAF